MNFHILTLFPDMVLDGLHTSIIGRAVENGLISIEAIDIREYSTDKMCIRDRHTRYLASKIPDSRLVILPGENHGSYVVHSRKLYHLIKKFLAEKFPADLTGKYGQGGTAHAD